MHVANGLTYTALFEQVEEGWTQARIAEVPGVITAAPSRDEAKELLRDALREYLESFMEPPTGLGNVGDREQLVLKLVAAPGPRDV